jgi:hypothetical protein
VILVGAIISAPLILADTIDTDSNFGSAGIGDVTTSSDSSSTTSADTESNFGAGADSSTDSSSASSSSSDSSSSDSSSSSDGSSSSDMSGVKIKSVPEIYQGYLPGPSGESEENYLSNKGIPVLISGTLTLVGGLAVLFIVIGGIQYLAAFDNDELAKKGKKTIQWAIVGLFIVVFSYGIVMAINSLNVS